MKKYFIISFIFIALSSCNNAPKNVDEVFAIMQRGYRGEGTPEDGVLYQYLTKDYTAKDWAYINEHAPRPDIKLPQSKDVNDTVVVDCINGILKVLNFHTSREAEAFQQGYGAGSYLRYSNDTIYIEYVDEEEIVENLKDENYEEQLREEIQPTEKIKENAQISSLQSVEQECSEEINAELYAFLDRRFHSIIFETYKEENSVASYNLNQYAESFSISLLVNGIGEREKKIIEKCTKRVALLGKRAYNKHEDKERS